HDMYLPDARIEFNLVSVNYASTSRSSFRCQRIRRRLPRDSPSPNPGLESAWPSRPRDANRYVPTDRACGIGVLPAECSCQFALLLPSPSCHLKGSGSVEPVTESRDGAAAATGR